MRVLNPAGGGGGHVAALDSGTGRLGSTPGRGRCVVLERHFPLTPPFYTRCINGYR